MQEILQIFESIAIRLNGGDALNYSASFNLYAAPDFGRESFQTILKSSVAPTSVLGGSISVTSSEVLEEIRDALNYRGDAGAHPNLSFLDSKDASLMFDEAIAAVETLLKGADALSAIWFKEGHPFYPVFWDFAFIIVHQADACVLIGSASD